MTIYNTPHYILTEYNKTQIKNDIAPSPHDGTVISFAEGKNGNDSFPKTYSMAWSDIKKRVIDKAIRHADKTTIPGMHGCTFVPNPTSKKHDPLSELISTSTTLSVVTQHLIIKHRQHATIRQCSCHM